MASRYNYLTFLLSLSFFLASCYSSEKGEENIFHYNEQTGIASLDPAFAKNQSVMWAVHQIFNTLVEVDSSLNIVPSLSSRWTVSADKKTFTFYLRKDVYFHDDPCFPNGKGRKMTAEDVVYSFNRIMGSETASPGA